jgi:hypothetical protein
VIKSFAKVGGICAIVIAIPYLAYLMIFPTFHIRYRLSLETEFDGQAHTSSGVVEIGYQIMPDSLRGLSGGSYFGGVMRGNAITIDLGQHGLVFVVNMMSLAPARKPGGLPTLRTPGSASLSELPLEAYGLPSNGMPSKMENVVLQVQQKNHAVEVAINKLPMFVRFTDINDPRSIEEIDPADLEATFGPGGPASARHTRSDRRSDYADTAILAKMVGRLEDVGISDRRKPRGRFVGPKL